MRDSQQFTFVFYDEDGVRGTRQVDIGVEPDKAPEVDAQPEIVRRVGPNTFKVTAAARIPFRGMVKDEQGLAHVRYAYTLRADKIGTAAQGDEIKVFGIALKLKEEEGPAGETRATATSPPSRPRSARTRRSSARSASSPSSAQRAGHGLPRPRPGQAASTSRPTTGFMRPTRRPSRTRRSGTTPKPTTTAQRPAGVRLPPVGAEATAAARQGPAAVHADPVARAPDTDLDSDVDEQGRPRPHKGQTQDRLKFKIVSENELLAEIGKEEEELRKASTRCWRPCWSASRSWPRWSRCWSDGSFKSLTDKDLHDEVAGLLGNVGLTEQFLDKSQTACKGIGTDFSRILKELRVNQIRAELPQPRQPRHHRAAGQGRRDRVPRLPQGDGRAGPRPGPARGMNNKTEITDSTKSAAREAQKKLAELKEKLRAISDNMNKVSARSRASASGSPTCWIGKC